MDSVGDDDDDNHYGKARYDWHYIENIIQMMMRRRRSEEQTGSD